MGNVGLYYEGLYVSDGPNNIVWLASYPKSGNTWLRFFLHSLIFGTVEYSEQVTRKFPYARANLRETDLQRGRNYLKTHLPYDSDELPVKQLGERAIYIVRNPLQIVISSWHYLVLRSGKQFRESSEDVRNEMFLKHAAQFAQYGGALEWFDWGYGSWSENVSSWLEAPIPVHVIRYEDLKLDPQGFGEGISSFLGRADSSERIKNSLMNSSLDAIKEIEDREIANGVRNGYFNQPAFSESQKIGKRFVRSGQDDEFLNQFSKEQLEKLRAGFGGLMDRFDYI